MHAPVHALSQHTPWAQKPDWHSVPLPQDSPFGFLPHEEFTQKFPDAHWMLVLVQMS
jgi:hypothetical protein